MMHAMHVFTEVCLLTCRPCFRSDSKWEVRVQIFEKKIGGRGVEMCSSGTMMAVVPIQVEPFCSRTNDVRSLHIDILLSV